MIREGGFRLGIALGLLLWTIPGLGRAATGACCRIRVDPPSVGVGGLVVVYTDAVGPAGTFDGLALRFFAVPGGSAALVGIDLDRRAGHYPIEIRSDRGASARTELLVVAREFPEERLSVPRIYTQPDPRTMLRIEREQRLLAALWGKSVARRYWQGPFLAPTDGPAGSPFGLRRYFDGEPRSPHAGIDFRAPEGAAVHAANRGRVVLARDLFFTGNTVVLDHGCGLFTLYVHLSRMGARAGALVDKGQEIGKVGMTGRATGPHLHFAARVGEARIDPATLLGRALDVGTETLQP